MNWHNFALVGLAVVVLGWLSYRNHCSMCWTDVAQAQGIAASPILLAEPAAGEPAAEAPPPVLSHKVTTIDGREVEMSRYAGRVLLIVNTASRCGHTPQYAGLQRLHDTYSEQGLAVLGFPSNDFRNQEPGSNEEIAQFCQERFGVTFDLFARNPVTGEDKQPLYRTLTAAQGEGLEPGEVAWNFEKFLVSREGEVVARFRSRVQPDSEELLEAIRRELARPAPRP